MIRVVSFDVDGTLIDPVFADLVWNQGIPELYAEKEGIDFDQAKKYVLKEYAKIGKDKIEWYDLDYWLRHFGLNRDYDEVLRNFRDKIRVYPEVTDVLNYLYKKYVLVISSNATKEFLDVELEGLKDYFSKIFSSISDFNQVRKSANFYSKICQILKIEPSEMVHVGDQWEYDYLVPKELGINAYYLDRSSRKSGDDVITDLSELKNLI
ncbi:MAG: HAD family hydrolase [Candidatus Hydrothermarchaeota archaeon]